MIIDGRTVGRDLKLEADVVIIGSGAGGAPAAYHLSRAGKRVIVVEEGGHFTSKTFNGDSYEMVKLMYRDAGATMAIGNTGVLIPLGRTLGGTTTINSGTMFRTPEEVLKEWQKDYGIKNITGEVLAPYFDEVEEITHTMEVPWELMGRNNQLFAMGAEKLGLHGFPLRRNMKNCEGSGICPFGCPRDAKQSMHLTYIPLSEEYGTTYYTYAHAEKILIKNSKATGISGYFLQGRYGVERSPYKFEIHAPVVIVSAGSIYTPLLLKKNGVGRASGMVGKNLRIHPAAKVMGFFEEDLESWKGIPQAYCVDEFAEEGIIFEGFWLPPSMLSIALPAFGRDIKKMMMNYNHLAGFGIMVHDTSVGNIKYIGDTPVITYRMNERDLNNFRKAIKIASEVYFAAGAKKIYPPIFSLEEIPDPSQLDTIDRIKLKPDMLELSAFHPMGTARMGNDPREAVVDENLETYEVLNLFVMDASIFPTSLGVNPQESIMAFSSYASDRILDRWDSLMRN